MESDIDKEEINSGIEPEDLHEKLEDGWKLVDVREDLSLIHISEPTRH